MRYDHLMRTTLDIADDVLFAAKEVAQRERTSVGDVVSRLARQALLAPPRVAQEAAAYSHTSATAAQLKRLGIRPLPARGGIVTNELINRIRDAEGI